MRVCISCLFSSSSFSCYNRLHLVLLQHLSNVLRVLRCAAQTVGCVTGEIRPSKSDSDDQGRQTSYFSSLFYHPENIFDRFWCQILIKWHDDSQDLDNVLSTWIDLGIHLIEVWKRCGIELQLEYERKFVTITFVGLQKSAPTNFGQTNWLNDRLHKEIIHKAIWLYLFRIKCFVEDNSPNLCKKILGYAHLKSQW